MEEKAYQRAALVIKAVTAAVVVLGAVAGVWKYFDTAERTFRQPYWERQVSLYFEATSAAAVLASSEDEEKLEDARATFWRLYWGPLALVEDVSVARAMKRFGDCLSQGCTRQRIQHLSLDLAHACRYSLGESWDLELEELQDRSP